MRSRNRRYIPPLTLSDLLSETKKLGKVKLGKEMVVAFLVSDGIFSLSGREGIYIRAETTASVEGRRFPRCSHATKGSLNHQQEKRFQKRNCSPQQHGIILVDKKKRRRRALMQHRHAIKLDSFPFFRGRRYIDDDDERLVMKVGRRSSHR